MSLSLWQSNLKPYNYCPFLDLCFSIACLTIWQHNVFDPLICLLTICYLRNIIYMRFGRSMVFFFLYIISWLRNKWCTKMFLGWNCLMSWNCICSIHNYPLYECACFHITITYVLSYKFCCFFWKLASGNIYIIITINCNILNYEMWWAYTHFVYLLVVAICSFILPTLDQLFKFSWILVCFLTVCCIAHTEPTIIFLSCVILGKIISKKFHHLYVHFFKYYRLDRNDISKFKSA